MDRIFVIEDDDNIRDLIVIALEGFGYEVHAFERAEEALEVMNHKLPSLVVFDLMLPGMSGLAAIKVLRGKEELKDIPVIILTAKDREFDKIAGLDGGADDYITKPFSVMEVAARIRSLLRRSGKKEPSKDILAHNTLSLNKQTREVVSNGVPVDLTLKEFELLYYLMNYQTRVVSRDEILNHIWGYDYDGETRTLDMHIRTLRQKIGEEHASCIKTVRGIGYRFVTMEGDQ